MMSTRHYMLDGRIYIREAKTLQQNGYQVVHIGYGDEASHYFTEDGVEIIQLKKLKKGNSLRTVFRSFKQSFLGDIFEAAANVNADVYHLHDIELCRIARKLQQLPHKPKVIYDAHEPYLENFLDFWKYASKLKLLVTDIPSLIAQKRAVPHLDYLIATEKIVAGRFAKKNPNTAIVHNYCYFKPSKQSKPRKQYDLIYAGTMSQVRGLEFILDAIKECKNRGQIVSCVFVGNFNKVAHEQSFAGKIDKYGIQDHIHFTGHIPFHDVEQYYKQSKIGMCLLPLNRSFKIAEPIKVFEYLLCGLPVIGSNFGPMQEILGSDDVGFAVDPYTAKLVADKILYLLENDRYQAYSSHCVDVAEAKYVWSKEEKILLTVYQNVLSQQGKQSTNSSIKRNQ